MGPWDMVTVGLSDHQKGLPPSLLARAICPLIYRGFTQRRGSASTGAGEGGAATNVYPSDRTDWNFLRETLSQIRLRRIPYRDKSPGTYNHKESSRSGVRFVLEPYHSLC
jgi:hypothetical protein